MESFLGIALASLQKMTSCNVHEGPVQKRRQRLVLFGNAGFCVQFFAANKPNRLTYSSKQQKFDVIPS
jgi:hypothetical protein